MAALGGHVAAQGILPSPHPPAACCVQPVCSPPCPGAGTGSRRRRWYRQACVGVHGNKGVGEDVGVSHPTIGYLVKLS